MSRSSAMNAGQPLRSDDTADPSNAPGLGFGPLGLFSVFSVAVSFDRLIGLAYLSVAMLVRTIVVLSMLAPFLFIGARKLALAKAPARV